MPRGIPFLFSKPCLLSRQFNDVFFGAVGNQVGITLRRCKRLNRAIVIEEKYVLVAVQHFYQNKENLKVL